MSPARADLWPLPASPRLFPACLLLLAGQEESWCRWQEALQKPSPVCSFPALMFSLGWAQGGLEQETMAVNMQTCLLLGTELAQPSFSCHRHKSGAVSALILVELLAWCCPDVLEPCLLSNRLSSAGGLAAGIKADLGRCG